MPERIRQDEFHLLFRHTTRLGASGNLIRTLPLSLRYLFLSREQSRGQTRARQRERESRDRREEGRVVDEMTTSPRRNKRIDDVSLRISLFRLQTRSTYRNVRSYNRQT
jgi:hypothetical protein